MDTSSHSISPSELAALISGPAAPLLLDVRRQAAFAASDRVIAGALRCAPDDVARFAAANAPRDVIVYCVHGHEVSQQAAQVLRDAGWHARFLASGIEGAQALPLVQKERA